MLPVVSERGEGGSSVGEYDGVLGGQIKLHRDNVLQSNVIISITNTNSYSVQLVRALFPTEKCWELEECEWHLE